MSFRKTWSGDFVSECGQFSVAYKPGFSNSLCILAKAGEVFKWFKPGDPSGDRGTASAFRWLKKQGAPDRS